MKSDQEPSVPGLGDRFPELDVQTSSGPVSLPDDYAGEWFVLFSHPGDFTPVCTTEFVAFQQRMAEFDALGVNLIGLSVDRVHSHIKWIEWIEAELDVGVEFPIIADDAGAVAEGLGMIHEAMGTSTVRSVYVVAPDGTIARAYEDVSPENHAEGILLDLEDSI